VWNLARRCRMVGHLNLTNDERSHLSLVSA